MRECDLMPNCSIDWAATGAMIGGIGTWVAGIGAIVVAILLYRQNKQVAQRQFDQTEYQHKISLYDKRYEVYACFIKYFSYAQRILTGKSNCTYISNSIFNNPNIYRQPLKGDGKESLNREMILEDLNLHKQIVNTIALSEFCFSREISKPLIFYIAQLLEYGLPENFTKDEYLYKYDDLTKRNLDMLLESIKNIQDENIVQKMKDELNLAYNDTLPQKKKRE